MGKKEMQRIPEEPSGPVPEITPELIKTTYEALEASGILFYSEEGGVYVPTERGWKLLMEIKPVKEEIEAYGHPSIKATNLKFLTITKENKVLDDSVIAIRANKSCKELSKEIREALKDGKKVQITIEADGIKEVISAFGSPALKLTDSKNIVIRKDDKIDEKTLAIMADKSADELNQELIRELRKSENRVKIILEVKS
ncbi:MAG: DUF371 domain-containing protein [Candidatus Aenigmatarchaeota archaeon]